LVEKNIDRLPILDILPGALLPQPQQTGRGERQELLEPILNIVVSPDGEESAQQLVDGHGEAVDVVGVTLQLRLVRARLTPGQLRDGDCHEDHEEAGDEILVLTAGLSFGRLAEGGEKGGVHFAAVAACTSHLCHEAGFVRRRVLVEIFDGGGEEGDAFF